MRVRKIALPDEELERELRRLYLEEKLTISEIARRFGLCYSAMRKWFVKFKIPFRPKDEAIKLAKERKREALRAQYKELLEELYVRQKLSTEEIAELLGWDSSTVWNRLKICGIPIRSREEAARLARQKYPVVVTEEQRRRLSEVNKGRRLKDKRVIHDEAVKKLAEMLRTKFDRVLVTSDRVPDIIAVDFERRKIVQFEVVSRKYHERRNELLEGCDERVILLEKDVLEGRV